MFAQSHEKRTTLLDCLQLTKKNFTFEKMHLQLCFTFTREHKFNSKDKFFESGPQKMEGVSLSWIHSGGFPLHREKCGNAAFGWKISKNCGIKFPVATVRLFSRKY